MKDQRAIAQGLLLQPGRVDYRIAWELQRRLVDARAQGRIADSLVLLEHPHVYTLGRRAEETNVLLTTNELERLGVQLHRIDRGGDVTYHGPGQLVGYPILDLRVRGSDVRRYVKDLEEVMIRALSDFGIVGTRRPGYVGVWTNGAKIAAIGVRVSRWITCHGFALNVCPDLDYFSYIIPCGIKGCGVTSLVRLLDRAVEMPVAIDVVARRFVEVFGFGLRTASIEEIDGVGAGLHAM